jgi:chaperonin GroES
MGKVVAIGPGKTNAAGSLVKMNLKKGDKVLYGKYSGTEITFEGMDLLIMRESDILAIL